MIGHYYGRLVGGALSGDYVLYDRARNVSIDASAYGSAFKYANGLPTEARCNAVFKGGVGRWRDVRARCDIYAHDEIVLFYSAQFRFS